MKTLTLAASTADLPADALWQGRVENFVCIEAELERKLLQIRAEHGQWAYATGLLELSNGKNLQTELECGETPSMWWTSLIYERHPKLSPNLYLIYKLRCLEMLLCDSGAASLHLKGGDRRLKNALRKLCENCGVKFQWTAGAKTALRQRSGLLRRFYNFAPAPVRAIVRYVFWLWQIRRKLPRAKSLPPEGPGKPSATIASYFPNIDMRAAGEGRFRSRYWESLHDALNAEAKLERPDGPHFVRWLFIRFPSPDLSLEDCVRLRDLFQKEGRDGLSFNFLEEFLGTSDLCAALSRWLNLTIRSFRLRKEFAQNCRFRNSRLDFWPYMQAQWAESFAGWRSLERCLFNRAFRNYCEIAGEQRWTLFPLENCPWERMLTEAARAARTESQVFGAQHSTLRPTDFRYFDAPETFSDPVCAAFQPDVIAGNGASSCGQWRQNAMPEDRIRQVEALRYLYLADEPEFAPGNAAEKLSVQDGEPLEYGVGSRLLILTSFFADETETHLRLVKEAFAENLLAAFRVVLKPHPYLTPTAWLESLDANARQKIFVSDSPLSLELTPGTRVWASNSTSASLEALLKGLPVMVMAASGDFDLCPVQEVPGLLRTATIADVRRGLRELKPLRLEPDYLDLNSSLTAWKKLLGLTSE